MRFNRLTSSVLICEGKECNFINLNSNFFVSIFYVELITHVYIYIVSLVLFYIFKVTYKLLYEDKVYPMYFKLIRISLSTTSQAPFFFQILDFETSSQVMLIQIYQYYCMNKDNYCYIQTNNIRRIIFLLVRNWTHNIICRKINRW